MKFVAQRFLFLLLSVWAAITINFFLPRMMPGNPAEVMLARYQGKLNPQSLHALAVQFGISHQPLWIQYGSYLTNLLHGNLGVSVSYYPTPVTTVIAQSFPWTLGLAGSATVISVVVGTWLGIISAWRRGTIIDNILPIATTVSSSIPYFWMALLLLYIFGFLLGWFPLGHAYSTITVPSWSAGFIGNLLSHAILPLSTILISSLGGWLMSMRNNMLHILDDDFMTFGEARGLSSKRLTYIYAARNAILPNLTGFSMALGFVVSGALLTEIVFSYPGLGYQLFTAVENEDYPLMQGLFLIIALAVLLANFITELIYARLDPRVRGE